VKITGPNGIVPANLIDNDDGTYRVEYEPKDAGKHVIDVTLKDKPIKDNPFKVLVKEGADESHSFVEGFTFTIRAKTKNATDKKDGGDDFKVTISGPEGEVKNVNVKDIGDGTYLCSYKLGSGGEYNINVLLNGKHVKGSPFKQIVN